MGKGFRIVSTAQDFLVHSGGSDLLLPKGPQVRRSRGGLGHTGLGDGRFRSLREGNEMGF